MSLREWFKNGWLKEHQTSKEEIQNLFKLVERDLSDCKAENLSLDWRYAIAYNAALQCCTIVLYCSGYKVARGQSEHLRTILSLAMTFGINYEEISDYLNSCRSKRNISDYDTAGTISSKEVLELTETAEELFSAVKSWVNTNYPQYL